MNLSIRNCFGSHHQNLENLREHVYRFEAHREGIHEGRLGSNRVIAGLRQ
jgi:hypothetical protein